MLGHLSRRTRVGSIAASAALAATALTGTSFATADALTTAVAAKTPHRHLDPGALPRGANPQIPYLVGDQIRDGAIRIDVAPRPNHLGLWETATGYLLLDQLKSNYRTRLTAYHQDGSSEVIARGGPWLSVVVSPDKRRVAVTKRVVRPSSRWSTREPAESSRAGRSGTPSRSALTTPRWFSIDEARTARWSAPPGDTSATR